MHFDKQTGERLIADVKEDSDRVVEIQHSPIAEREMQSREDFYGDMIWIVDARDLAGHFTSGTSHDLATCNPMSQHCQWFSKSMLFKRWSVARKPVYFDSLIQNSSTPTVPTPSAEHVLWRVLEFDRSDDLGFIAPVRSDWLVPAVLNGDSVPLMRCEEEDESLPERTRRDRPLIRAGEVPRRKPLPISPLARQDCTRR